MQRLPVAVNEESLSLSTKRHEHRADPELDAYTVLDTRDKLHPVSNYKLKGFNWLKSLFVERED